MKTFKPTFPQPQADDSSITAIPFPTLTLVKLSHSDTHCLSGKATIDNRHRLTSNNHVSALLNPLVFNVSDRRT